MIRNLYAPHIYTKCKIFAYTHILFYPRMHVYKTLFSYTHLICLSYMRAKINLFASKQIEVYISFEILNVYSRVHHFASSSGGWTRDPFPRIFFYVNAYTRAILQRPRECSKTNIQSYESHHPRVYKIPNGEIAYMYKSIIQIRTYLQQQTRHK